MRVSYAAARSFLYFNRIAKMSLASMLSWEIARQIGSKHPFFAPLAAILCLQVTVEESIQKGYQRILGIIAGVIVAQLASQYMSVNGWSIGLLMFISLTLAKLFKFDENIFSQVGVSALMVLTVGIGNNQYGFDRIVETIIGAVTAIIINMIVFPPDYTKEAKQSIDKAAVDLIQHLGEFSEFVCNVDVRDDREVSVLKNKNTELYKDLGYAAARTTKAVHALRFSPLIQQRRKQLIQYQQLLCDLQQVYVHLLEVQRIIKEWKQAVGMDANAAKEWGHRFTQLAEAIEQWQAVDFSGSVIDGQLQNLKSIRPSVLTNDAYNYALEEETNHLIEDIFKTKK